jgi:aminoglycoside phosphotransferase (APT) family kinase protein
VSWQRVARLDGPELVARVAAASGTALEYLGPCPGGEVGAAYVRWPDGADGVLTWQPGVGPERFRQVAGILSVARATGLPVPEYRLIVPLPDAVAVVQERLPGRVAPELTGELLTAMLDANRRFAGLLAGRTDIPAIRLYLAEDGPGFCLHGPLAEYSERTRRVLGWIEEVGRAYPDEMPGDDLVHMDFHHQNVLSEGGALTGIIDWDGTGRGDHRFDLVTLRFAVPAGRTDLAARLDAEIAARLTPDALRPYWASMALRQIDWAIRHWGDELIDHNLTITESRLN